MKKSGTVIRKIIFLAVAIPTCIFQKVDAQTKNDQLDKLITTYVNEGKFNGSVLIAEHDKITYKKGFGFANMEWNIPNQPDTKFRLGSITKQFTAMLVLQLVEQGKLKLDASVSAYLPDYPQPNGNNITIHHLLTHTSGIPNYTSFLHFFEEKSRYSYSPSKLIKLFADSTLQFKPGEKYAYSNSGFILLGAIIEKVTGKSYEQVLQEQILTPLHMTNSGYDHADILIKNRASAYEKRGITFYNAPYIDMSIPYAAGSIYSTVEDLYLWDQALYANQLLQKKNMDLLFTKHISTGKGYYGYGWFIDEMSIGNTKEVLQTIEHGGSVNGFSSLLTRIPSDHSLIILLNNTGAAPLREMRAAISAVMYGKSFDDTKKSVAYSLLNVMEKQGVAKALAHYQAIKDSSNYLLDEDEMNRGGYELLQSGKIKEAAMVFKLNVEAFPKSSNAYDSYGEALLAMGDKKAAIENYKKSVKLNPANENGISVLKKEGVNTDELITKVSVESLKILAGNYQVADPKTNNEKEWKITIELTDGSLYGNDRGYRYKLIPTGENEFINQDDGASLVFNVTDKNAITFVLFGKVKFKKIN